MTLKIWAKSAGKAAIGRSFSRDTLEKLTEYAILENEPSVSLAGVEIIPADGTDWDSHERNRRILWDKFLPQLPGKDLLVLEFGVFRGDSIRYLAQSNTSPKSRFIGFDSFEGLPEEWRGMAAGHFSQDGQLPKIDDSRVSFRKGWFSKTLPAAMDEIEKLSKGRALLVHLDADLYSSTLYVLFMLGMRFKHYHVLFDEFAGHETRALFNYMQATGAQAKFFHRLDWRGSPTVVSGELTIP